MNVTHRVPGKVVLLGEYAVLDGAPALVAAVDRGVAVHAESGPDLVIHTPGQDDRFVRAALERIGAKGTFTFSAFNLPDTPFKVGLGSSAAATVAAVRAGLSLSSDAADDDQVFSLALEIHRAVQGSGSGIDVAASTYRGVLRYQNERAEPAPPLTLPWTLVWSGGSAQTGPRVKTYLRWKERQAFVDLTTQLVHAFGADPIHAFRRARRALETMADSASVAYRTPGLDAICDLAEAHGGGGKASGAGGGDIAIAILPDEASLRAFNDACLARDLTPITVGIAR
ncbi:MAG: mevalonate kinase [Myxococcota bacterium]